jgi:hypothetical protein
MRTPSENNGNKENDHAGERPTAGDHPGSSTAVRKIFKVLCNPRGEICTSASAHSLLPSGDMLGGAKQAAAHLTFILGLLAYYNLDRTPTHFSPG